MRGELPLILILASAVCLQPIKATAQNQRAGNFILNAQGGLQVLGQAPPVAPEPSGMVPPTGDLLEFSDGSLMHGELKRIDTASGLNWANPSAMQPIALRPAHIDFIRFEHADSVTVKPTAHLRFMNGDDLFGTVSSLDDDHLVFSTWFGKALAIQRASVQSVSMLSSNFTILYEGPGDADGWIVGNHNPESWTFVDGTFISGAPGSLGRDFGLTGSSTIEFDLAWNDIFELMVNIYSDAVDHLDTSDSYTLEFTRDSVNLRRVDSSHQFPFRTFGSAPLPNLAGKSKAHVTIQSNKEEGTIAVYIDNVLAKRWKDENGFGPNGGGVLFQQTGMTRATVKLSNFKVSQWQGRYEPETTAIATNVDVIRFINHDQAAGKITGISGGKVTMALAEAVLEIPLQRVTQINFAATNLLADIHDPWEVRAQFPRGGSVSFQLEKWNDKEVSGRSAIFGSLAFQTSQIRRLEFNLDQPKLAAPAASDIEFEGLDE